MKIKKLKHSPKKEQPNENHEGRNLENQEENQHLKNINQELEKQIKKIKEDKNCKTKGLRRFRVKTIYWRTK